MFNHKNGSVRRASKQQLELEVELEKVRFSQGGVVLEKSTKINEKKAPYTPPVLHRTSKAGSPASVVDMVNQVGSAEKTMRNTGKGEDATPVFNPLVAAGIPVKNSALGSAQQAQTETVPTANLELTSPRQAQEGRASSGCLGFFARLLPSRTSSKAPGNTSK